MFVRRTVVMNFSDVENCVVNVVFPCVTLLNNVISIYLSNNENYDMNGVLIVRKNICQEISHVLGRCMVNKCQVPCPSSLWCCHFACAKVVWWSGPGISR